MTRAAPVLLAVLVLVACAKPDPLTQAREAIEAGDLERARAVLAPYAATAAAPDPPPDEWPARIMVRWTHPTPERVEGMNFTVKPQGYTWFTSVSHRHLNGPDDSPRITALRGSWEGCAEVRAVAANGMAPPDLEGNVRRIVSDPSNTVTIGPCLDPPPTPIPEPSYGVLAFFGALALIALRMAVKR